MHTILLVGTDQTLLRTRAAVLRDTGCGIVCASLPDALKLQAQHNCELVILCHSLSEEATLALAYSLHQRWPATGVLQLVRFGDLTMRPVTVTEAISTPEPECLLSRVADMLRLRGVPPAASATVPPSALLH